MDWHIITGDLGGYLSAPWLQVVLTLVAIMCGAIVGAERERRDKPAGLRTLGLVCLGATVFTITSHAFTSTTGDSGRVAAQIVTGIGFLGAGAILHSAGLIRGMTTAATIWATAAIGMVVGTGYAGAGLGLSLLVWLVLTAIRFLEARYFGDVQETRVEVGFKTEGGKTLALIERMLEEFGIDHPLELDRDTSTDDHARACIRGRVSRRQRREFLGALAELPAVDSISSRSDGH